MRPLLVTRCLHRMTPMGPLALGLRRLIGRCAPYQPEGYPIGVILALARGSQGRQRRMLEALVLLGPIVGRVDVSSLTLTHDAVDDHDLQVDGQGVEDDGVGNGHHYSDQSAEHDVSHGCDRLL